MTDFAVLRAPSQVLFGAGMAAAAGRVAAGHGRRVLVITDPVIAGTPGFATVVESLAAMDVTVFTDAAVDVPRSAVDAAVALGAAAEPDVIVAVGGGSVIDLGEGHRAAARPRRRRWRTTTPSSPCPARSCR